MITPKIRAPMTVPMIEPAPAGERHAADHRHGDGVELVHHAHAGLRRQILGTQHHGSKRSKHRGDRVDQDLVMFDLDARDARRLLVGADGIAVLAVFRVAQDELEQDRQR